ncbi:MAG: NAD(P)/FAD-dependent oxidoreductase [bacterium]|nr:NAD(P)/FAD-dependent oxidoreductase [bacterium]
MRNYDVTIIGAGLAGLQCARLLRAKGVTVLLADRKADLSNGIHTTGIFVRKTFEDFAFPAGTLGKPISRVSLYSPNLRRSGLESSLDEFRIGRMDVLYKSLLNDCVGSGVDFLAATRFISVETYDGGSIVTLESEGTPVRIDTKVLVGADGANSSVAKAIGLDQNRELIVGFEEVYERAKQHNDPRLHCFLDAELAPGYLAWIADDGHEIHVGVGGYAAHFKPRAALKTFKNKTRNIVDCRGLTFVESRGGQIPVGGVLKKIANRAGLLIGDAAGAVSPLTAGGLDPCMRLSTYAADIIAESVRTRDPSILLQYSGNEFRARFVSRLWMRRAISLLKSQTFLELGCALLRGRLGNRFARHVFFGRGSFPDKRALGTYRANERPTL